jgi:hypothetical protein
VRWSASREQARDRLGTIVVFAGSIGLLFCGLLGFQALSARSDLREGTAPSPLWVFLPVPWRAEIAEVEWVGADGVPDDLPACALFLGQDGGTALLYVPDPDGSGFQEGQTHRLPASSLAIRLRPDQLQCPPGGRRLPPATATAAHPR